MNTTQEKTINSFFKILKQGIETQINKYYSMGLDIEPAYIDFISCIDNAFFDTRYQVSKKNAVFNWDDIEDTITDLYKNIIINEKEELERIYKHYSKEEQLLYFVDFVDMLENALFQVWEEEEDGMDLEDQLEHLINS